MNRNIVFEKVKKIIKKMREAMKFSSQTKCLFSLFFLFLLSLSSLSFSLSLTLSPTNLLNVVAGEMAIEDAAVIACPPAAVLLADVGDDRVLQEAQLVCLLRLVVVQRFAGHLLHRR
jgi:hypothetical protein